jgi:hypothetical protein
VAAKKNAKKMIIEEKLEKRIEKKITINFRNERKRVIKKEKKNTAPRYSRMHL